MAVIQSLAPRVCLSEAVNLLHPGILARAVGTGPLRLVAAAFVPFYLFRIQVESHATRQTHLMASDGVSGTLDPYGFDHVPNTGELTAVESENCLPLVLDPNRGKEQVTQQVRRMAYLGGFFRLRGLKIECEQIAVSLYMPYWLGFFGTGNQASLRVVDAVRGSVEGAKARTLFSNWIARKRAAL